MKLEPSEYRNLLMGCGHKRDKRLEPLLFGGTLSTTEAAKQWRMPREWQGELDTLDYESPCNPSIVWDLNVTPWCRPGPLTGKPVAIPDDYYAEVHAYEVLEHLGQQGDYRAFFETFSEVWRLLRPGGFLCATVPARRSMWAWGDPGHTRVIYPCHLIFLDQSSYTDQLGRTTMTDYRRTYRADFETVHSHDNGETHQFVLRAVKPSRCPKI